MEVSLISIATPLVMNEIEIEMTQTAKQVVSQVAKVLLQNLQENPDGITAHDAGKAFFEGVIAKRIAPHKEKLDQLTDHDRLVEKVINRAIPILFDNPATKSYSPIFRHDGCSLWRKCCSTIYYKSSSPLYSNPDG